MRSLIKIFHNFLNFLCPYGSQVKTYRRLYTLIPPYTFYLIGISDPYHSCFYYDSVSSHTFDTHDWISLSSVRLLMFSLPVHCLSLTFLPTQNSSDKSLSPGTSLVSPRVRTISYLYLSSSIGTLFLL